MSESNQIATTQNSGEKPTVKRIKISKYLKNFFFNGWKSRPEYKGFEKELGTILTITIMVSKRKNILRAETATDKKDSPFTEEEMKKFLKNLPIKQKTIDESKNIIVQLEMIEQNIFIQQTKHDGSTKFFEL